MHELSPPRVEFETRSLGPSTFWIHGSVFVGGLVALVAVLLVPTARIPIWTVFAVCAGVLALLAATSARARIVRDRLSGAVLLELRRYRLGPGRTVALSTLAHVDLRVHRFGVARSLRLADLQGRSLELPLDMWNAQEQLLARVAVAARERALVLAPNVERLLGPAERNATAEREAMRIAESVESGADPDERDHERAERWFDRRERGIPARRGLFQFVTLASGLVALAIALNVSRARSPGMTGAEAVARVTSGVRNPLSGTPPADLYLVPLDTAVVDDVRAVAGPLERRVDLRTDVTGILRFDPSVLDRRRGQLKISPLTAQLARGFHAAHGRTSAAVIGVTSLDVYLESASDDRFAFAAHRREVAPGGYVGAFGVVSTARMHGTTTCGRGWRRIPPALWEWIAGLDDPDQTRTRLRKMVMRVVALQYYGVPPTTSGHAITRSPIRSLCDLDRLEERFGVPLEVLRRVRPVRRPRE